MNNHYGSTFKDHNSLCLNGSGEIIQDNFSYAFDPCFEELKKKQPSQFNISTNKRTKPICLQGLISNHSNLTLKHHIFPGLCSLGELVIDNCSCAFDPGFQVFDKNNHLQTNISPIKRGNIGFVYRTQLIIILIQFSSTRIICI